MSQKERLEEAVGEAREVLVGADERYVKVSSLEAETDFGSKMIRVMERKGEDQHVHGEYQINLLEDLMDQVESEED